MSQGTKNFKQNLLYRIRISGIKLIFIPIILIGVICFLLIKIPFKDILVPKTVDDLTKLAVSDINNMEYFSISSENWLYSGYNNYKDDEIQEYIYYKLIDEECYFMLVSSKYVDESDMTLKEKDINVSVAKRSDIFNSFLNEFALDIQWNFDSLNKASAPIILSSTSYNTAMYKLLLAILLVLLIYLILFKLYLVLIILFPLLSPQFGNKHKHSIDSIKNRSEFAMLLQSELDNHIYKTNDLYITKNYIINLSPSELTIIPLNKLAFIFEHGNLHKFLWLYMKVTHTIYFLCSNSLKCHFTHKNSGDIDIIMKLLKDLNPELMVGYSTENQMKYLELVKNNK